MIYRSSWATPVREESVLSSPHAATLTGLWLGGNWSGKTRNRRTDDTTGRMELWTVDGSVLDGHILMDGFGEE
jgi:hypothetical protein